MATASGSVPGDNSTTQFDLALAFGSGVDSGLYEQDTGGSFDTVQINEQGTYRIQWTAGWTGTISSPSEGQRLLAQATTGTGVQTHNFGFGGLPVAGAEYLRATGDDYSGTPTAKLSAGGYLHWPTDENTPPAFETSLIGMTSNNNTGSALDLLLWVFIQRIDAYMISEADALSWTP